MIDAAQIANAKSHSFIIARVIAKALGDNYAFLGGAIPQRIILTLATKILDKAFEKGAIEYNLFVIPRENQKDVLIYNRTVDTLKRVILNKDSTLEDKKKADEALINEARKVSTYNHLPR